MRDALLTTVAMTALSVAASTTTAHDAPHHHDHDHAPRDHAVRFHSNRTAAELALPVEDDAFVFAILGDRTGGPADGVKVLAEAVRDINTIEPDLVMTVGDLVQGYTDTETWMGQMEEFRDIMDQLTMPWFPVAGNHDIYWSGTRHHEAEYETHFGPLWYAFEHKECLFVALYSDEGNPETGLRSFNDPDAQRMSPEQFAWLDETLTRGADAKHVFVFLHHPRWLGRGYGDDWERVHERLAAAGNVRAVFAGHIHRMRYDGARDGIEYVALATTGGVQEGLAAKGGYLHHFHLVTVRDDHLAMAALPVGEVLDVRAITGQVSDDVARLARLQPQQGAAVGVGSAEAARGTVAFTIDNPSHEAIDVTLTPASNDERWRFEPDHTHGHIAAGGARTFRFRYAHPAGLDAQFDVPELALQIDYLPGTMRIPVRAATHGFDLALGLDAPAPRVGALRVNGRDGCAIVRSADLPLDDGPLTLECWFRAASFSGRTGLLAKTENSEYGFFVSDGHPGFYLFLGSRYVRAEVMDLTLETERWYHLAADYDGQHVRLYLDGAMIDEQERSGVRRRNDFPLCIGADVDGRGEPTSHFDGWIDGVHLSATARYAGAAFTPAKRPEADAATRLLLNMDAITFGWLYDESSRAAHARVVGAGAIDAAAP